MRAVPRLRRSIRSLRHPSPALAQSLPRLERPGPGLIRDAASWRRLVQAWGHSSQGCVDPLQGRRDPWRACVESRQGWRSRIELAEAPNDLAASCLKFGTGWREVERSASELETVRGEVDAGRSKLGTMHAELGAHLPGLVRLS